MEKLDTREELSVDKKSPPIPVHQRLFKQDTVNSLARRRANLKVDSLDLSLSSVYNHEADLFLNRKQTVLQMVNSPDNPIKKRLFEEMKERQRKSLHHPLIIGGLTERKSPHSVKLICSGHHTPTTNPGYSRQPVDGNIFNY